MVIRKLTLSEWFLRYQLLKFQQEHFYLPVELDVDVTELGNIHSLVNNRIPMTALVVKAAALLQKKAPYSHRVMFSTLLGPRLVEINEPIVNLPFVIYQHGKTLQSAIVIEKADVKTVSEIQDEIRDAVKRPIEKFPIVHFIENRKNNFLNRLILRGLYFLAYCVPQIYIKRRGGGISVSSLYNNHAEGFRLRPYAFGNTAFSLCFSGFEIREQKKILKIGIGYDHTAFTGNEMAQALKALSEILQQELPRALENPSYKPTRPADIVV